jgi:hypothetical protein
LNKLNTSLGWWSVCLASVRSWVQTPVLQ